MMLQVFYPYSPESVITLAPAVLSLPIELAAYGKGDIQCRTSANVVHLSGELSY